MRALVMAAVLAGCGPKAQSATSATSTAEDPAPDATLEAARLCEAVVGVQPFEHQSGDPNLAGFGRGFADLVAQDLAARGATVESRNVWEMDPPVRSIGVAVLGSALMMGEMVQLSVRLTQTDSTPPSQVITAFAASGTLTDLGAVLQEVQNQVGAAMCQDEPAGPPVTTSLDATVALGRALGALDAEDRDAAIQELDAALASDPALARARELRDWLDGIEVIPTLDSP